MHVFVNITLWIVLPQIHNFFRYDSMPASNRIKKHLSLSSLSQYQATPLSPSSGGGGNGSAASLTSRNSYQRRSAIIPRNDRRSMQMSAINVSLKYNPSYLSCSHGSQSAQFPISTHLMLFFRQKSLIGLKIWDIPSSKFWVSTNDTFKFF